MPDSLPPEDEIARLRAENARVWAVLTLIRDFAGSTILVRNDALDHIHAFASAALAPLKPSIPPTLHTHTNPKREGALNAEPACRFLPRRIRA